jgi:hypothetical protein
LILPDTIAETGIMLKDQLFDLRGLSVYSSLAVPTLRDYIKGGTLPCFKVKGKILVKRSEFERWLEGYRMHKSRDIESIVDDVMKNLKRH